MTKNSVTYFVDETGDGVLFGPKGRDRLMDPDASQFFMLDMVHCASEDDITRRLAESKGQIYPDDLRRLIAKHWDCFKNIIGTDQNKALRHLELINKFRVAGGAGSSHWSSSSGVYVKLLF